MFDGQDEQMEYLKDYIWEFYEYIDNIKISRDEFVERYSYILSSVYRVENMSNLKIVKRKNGYRLIWGRDVLLRSEEEY